MVTVWLPSSSGLSALAVALTTLSDFWAWAAAGPVAASRQAADRARRAGYFMRESSLGRASATTIRGRGGRAKGENWPAKSACAAAIIAITRRTAPEGTIHAT